jgi:hypothetical protein
VEISFDCDIGAKLRRRDTVKVLGRANAVRPSRHAFETCGLGREEHTHFIYNSRGKSG